MHSESDIIHVLLIEDNQDDYLIFQELLKRTSSKRKFDLSWVSHEAEALTPIYSGQFDVIFVDYTLTQGTGVKLVETATSNNAKGPFVLLTGHDDPNLYKQASERGFYSYLLKDELTSSFLERTITYAIERKRFENEIISEKAFSTSVLQAMPYMILEIDAHNIITKTNYAASKITGYTVDELQGKDWAILFSDNNVETLQSNLKTNNRQSFRMDCTTKNGSVRIIEWLILNHLKDDNEEKLLTLVLSGKDVTDEDEREAKEQQKQKMESLGHMAGGVAHEINNLLQPILLSAEIMDDMIVDKEKFAPYTDKIIRNASNAAQIVEDILIFARQDIKTVSSRLFLNDLQDAIEMVKDIIPLTVTIRTDIDDNCNGAYYAGREHDMHRVIRNLVINASQAMRGKGEISISVNKDPKNDDCLLLNVVDTGEGIAEERLNKIFTPFYTTKETGQGVGLGLPMIHSIVDSWDGSIHVQSVIGKGSTFTITLPSIAKP